MNRISHILLCALGTLALPANAAEQVYSWIDDSGTTHFSESPPANTAVDDVELLEVLPASGSSPDTTTDDGFYSVINQAERMQTRRLQNEKLAAEKRQADAEASKARAEAKAALQDQYHNDNVNYYPAYPSYPRYRHYYPRYRRYPGHGHRPVHGDRPGHVNRPGNPRPSSPRSSLGKTPGMPHY